MLHWGSEYDRQVTESQKEIAKLLFDNGVGLIIGSHSHFVGPIELPEKSKGSYGKQLVAYSLGNLISVADNSEARNGCVLNVTVAKDREGLRIADISYVPTFSAAPSEELSVRDHEVLDTLGALSFYRQGYYDRISDRLYEHLISAIDRMKEQTGLPDCIAGS